MAQSVRTKKVVLGLILIPLIAIAAPRNKLRWNDSLEVVKAAYPKGKPDSNPADINLCLSSLWNLWGTTKQALGYTVQLDFLFGMERKMREHKTPDECDWQNIGEPYLAEVDVTFPFGKPNVVYQQFKKMRLVFENKYGQGECGSDCNERCWLTGTEEGDSYICLALNYPDDFNPNITIATSQQIIISCSRTVLDYLENEVIPPFPDICQ